MDAQVTAYIEKQQSSHKEILRKVREIFQKTLPGCEEKMMWGVPTYSGGKYYLAAMKQRVHVGFAISGLNREEVSLFEGTGKTMRHVKISTIEEIHESELVKLIALVDQQSIC
jgi:hypothetical protein